MPDYILFMHGDANRRASDAGQDPWDPYLARLKSLGCFQGGSAIGAGACVNKAGANVPVSTHITGFIRVRADSIDHARELVPGNPVFEAGGTVEIRELPMTGTTTGTTTGDGAAPASTD